MTQPARLLLAVITDKRPEASLGFAVALLKFQVAIASTAIQTELHHFDTIDDALNAFASSPEHSHLFVAKATVSFDPMLAVRAIESAAHDFVAGIYPLPGYDWAKVAAAPPDADLRLLATTHNLEVDESDGGEYGILKDVRELGAFVITRAVADALVETAPRHETGWLLFAPGVWEGAYETADKRLLRLWGRPVAVDLVRLCGNFGAVEFAGTISARSVVR